MAYKNFDGLSLNGDSQTALDGNGHKVDLPDASFVRDAAMTRDGLDLVLDGPGGQLIIKDYFADDSMPNLVAPDGLTLTPELVQSFLQSSSEYAQNGTLNDVSPVGQVAEVTGHATVTHPDGSTETIAKGTPIYQGDVVETDAKGAVNITFIDDTSFAVSEDARLAIDEYVYDPATQSGETNFSVLKGVFVFTSGLIGRDDPDDVHIKTPVGSIGIRGTIIAGNVDTGEITVVEGAIVLTDHNGHEMTLATQFETARFHNGEGIENVGQLSAKEVGEKFYVVSQVSPTLFSSVNDAAAEEGAVEQAPAEEAPVEETTPEESAPVTDGEDHSGTTTGDTSTVAALPPVPPPVSGFEVSGFTTTASGLNTTQNNTTLTPAQTTTVANFLTTDVAAAATTTNVTEAAPAPVDTITDPRGSTGSSGGGSTNHVPIHHPEAAETFFKSGEGQSWHYNFNKEFVDDGGQSNLTYQLSTTTIAALDAWEGDILVANGWTFNATNGELVLNFNNNFSTAGGTLSSIDINVQARDSSGAVSGYVTYDFSAYNAQITTLGPTYTTNGQTVSVLTPTTTQVDAFTNNMFFGDGDDMVILNSGTGNYVNLGDGRNTVNVEIGAAENTVVGGDNRDIVTLQTARTALYGMDGDDDFRLVLNTPSSVVNDLQNPVGAIMDGGHSNFRAGVTLNGLGVNVAGENGGRGDSLVLEGNGTLDFGLVDGSNEITSIERIDASASTLNQTIILDYADILRLTDDKNALVINIANNDRLELTNMTNMIKVLENVSIDDAAQGEATSMKSYDVFTDGTVTLLISATGAAATAGVTMDGTNVAI